MFVCIDLDSFATRQAGIEATMGDIISCLEERVQWLANKTVSTPVGIASCLKLSPNSMEKVSQYSCRGIFQSSKLLDAAPTGKRSGFLVNVVNCLRPIITKICEIPKFRDGNSDAAGVCDLVLGAMRKDTVSNSRKRKLFEDSPKPRLSKRGKCLVDSNNAVTPPLQKQSQQTPVKKVDSNNNAVTPPLQKQSQQTPVTRQTPVTQVDSNNAATPALQSQQTPVTQVDSNNATPPARQPNQQTPVKEKVKFCKKKRKRKDVSTSEAICLSPNPLNIYHILLSKFPTKLDFLVKSRSVLIIIAGKSNFVVTLSSACVTIHHIRNANHQSRVCHSRRVSLRKRER